MLLSLRQERLYSKLRMQSFFCHKCVAGNVLPTKAVEQRRLTHWAFNSRKKHLSVIKELEEKDTKKCLIDFFNKGLFYDHLYLDINLIILAHCEIKCNDFMLQFVFKTNLKNKRTLKRKLRVRFCLVRMKGFEPPRSPTRT